MQVQTRKGRDLQDGARQNLPISHDYDRAWRHCANLLDRLSIFDPLRLQDRYLGSNERPFDRRRLNSLFAPHGFIWLGDDPNDLVFA